MPKPLSLLAFRLRRADAVPLRRALSILRQLALSALVCAALRAPASAYTVVVLASSAPAGTEQALIAAATAQFNATVFVNPFVKNTYQLTVFGPNPAFNPAPTTQDLLDSAVAISTQTYIYGFADGQVYERHHDLGTIGSYIIGISTTSPTCASTITQLQSDIYSQFFSTPTVIPPLDTVLYP